MTFAHRTIARPLLAVGFAALVTGTLLHPAPAAAGPGPCAPADILCRENPDGQASAPARELVPAPAAGSRDSDGDGLSDMDELTKYFTNGFLPDSDMDGVADGVELKEGRNPLNPLG